jgi:hypothetical protein
VRYDVTLLARTQNVFVNSASEFTEERSFIIRPGSYIQLDIAEQNQSSSQKITDVRKIVVLSCEKT